MKLSSANSVRRVFSPEVSTTYELVNHVLTLGHDVLWRRRAARIAARSGGTQWADICTGTGEMAANLSRLAPSGTQIRGVDLSLSVLGEARKKPEARNIRFIVSNVRSLSFPDESLDLLTISFATRNINLSRDALVQTFAEFCRVLKPGGRFVHLETSQPTSLLIRRLFHSYVKLLVKAVGGTISGSSTGYAYLAHTIPRFYPPEELGDVISEAGFSRVVSEKLLFGIAAIHQGVKP